jgi:hypothetical protein
MAKPQSPELRRSGRTPDLDPDNVGTRLGAAGRPSTTSGGGGPVPPENRPGHHPDHDQDRPDPTEFARRTHELAERRAAEASGDDDRARHDGDHAQGDGDQARGDDDRGDVPVPTGDRGPISTGERDDGGRALRPARRSPSPLGLLHAATRPACRLAATSLRALADRLDPSRR